MRQTWRRLSSGEDRRRGAFRPRDTRQLIVNACSLSDVAFTLLASFRGLAVSSCASFERLTLYHSRVIKQADILRVVLQSRPDLRCIECHRRRPPPSSPKFLPDVRRFCRDPSAHRRVALSPRVCSLHSAQRSIYFTHPACRLNPKRRSARRGMRRALRTQAFRGILLACCLVTLMVGSTSMWGEPRHRAPDQLA